MGRAVVTGGFGFVGSHVVEHLLRDGDDVTVIDLGPRPDDLDTGVADEALRVVAADVRDSDAVGEAVRGADVVYHLAALVGVDRYLDRPLDVLDVNVIGTRAVLDATRRAGAKFVLASTSEVYGRNPAVPWSEDADRVLGSTAADRWCYSSSKAVAEHMTHAVARQHGLRTCIVRYFNVYGPRQRPAYVLSRTIDRLLDARPAELYDGGHQTRCFTFVADAAAATVLAGRSPAADGQCFNIGSDRETTVADAVALATAAVGAAPGATTVDTAAAIGPLYEDIERRVPDVARVARVLGWRSSTPLEQGIRLTVEWARRNARSRRPDLSRVGA